LALDYYYQPGPDKGIGQLYACLHDNRQSKIHDQLKMSQVDGVTLSGGFLVINIMGLVTY